MEGSDAAQVVLARKGDRDAFRLLVERHSRNVFRLAYRMTGNEHDAEEVVQETFLKAYQQLDRFEQRASFGTWIHRIAANCSVDLVRSRGRHADRRAPAPGDGPEDIEIPAENQPLPDRLVWGKEIQRRIQSAMSTLTPHERAAFTLRHFEGWSIDEIGRQLGLQTNATKHSIFRAVRKMRIALEPFASGWASQDDTLAANPAPGVNVQG
jgi:RNA polymerase sigma-70 factor (ECF subfamily)